MTGTVMMNGQDGKKAETVRNQAMHQDSTLPRGQNQNALDALSETIPWGFPPSKQAAGACQGTSARSSLAQGPHGALLGGQQTAGTETGPVHSALLPPVP